MYNKKYPFIPDSYLGNNNKSKRNSPYRARNTLDHAKYTSVFAQETTPEAPVEQQPIENGLPPGDIPALPAEPGTIPIEEADEVGYLSVGVFTASGALPVPDAVVTVYVTDEQGGEDAVSHQVTDANGQVPLIELPVVYNRLNPLESSEYYFTTYNLRVQAINYYTANILGFRVFPEITTSFMIELIPAAVGPTTGTPEQTTVIPPSPIDAGND